VIIILCGSIGQSVTGGQAWANMQYLLGFQKLGHDVYYLEDCGDWSYVYNWETQLMTDELDYPAQYIRDCLEPIGMVGKWIYRAGDRSTGMTIQNLAEICAQADVLIVRGLPILEWRDEYNLPRRRVFIDVDPGFTQMRFAKGEPAFVSTIRRCEALFTVGTRIGSPDCTIPRWAGAG